VAVLSFFVNRERLSKHLFLSIGICILGITMVIGTSLGAINLWGVFLAIAAAVVYSCYIVLGR
jgi:drug/metabolite transporter (DMT)-like permease